MTTIQQLLTDRAGLFEVSEVRTFRGYKTGTSVIVEIRVHDAGEGAGHRYEIEAFDADLPPEDRHGGSPGWSMGDASNDLQEAIANVHWNQIGTTDSQ